MNLYSRCNYTLIAAFVCYKFLPCFSEAVYRESHFPVLRQSTQMMFCPAEVTVLKFQW